jgi:tetratricopeptide (TPR) repeat protein
MWAAALLLATNVDLNEAYEYMRAQNYEKAIPVFREAVRQQPNRASIRKDLGYALLKIGETRAARDEFAVALANSPDDTHLALEYAYLCHETGETRQARRILGGMRNHRDAAIRNQARQAFDNVDRPLAEGIARWREAARLEPGNFSAHLELARLADTRDEWALAAEQYEKAWRLKPADRKLLLPLGLAWKELGRAEESRIALLAASRGAEPHTAMKARELLPERYPFVYEFERALALDPGNVELRRELAYLHLEMKDRERAESEFRRIIELAPDDMLSTAQLGFLLLQRNETLEGRKLLDRVLASDGVDQELADRVRSAVGLPKALRRRPETPKRDVATEARDLADKSYQAGYLKDALKYLRVVHENDPLDFDVMLKLGNTYNMLKDDREALKWFELAEHSPDPSIAGQAQRATGNLRPQFARTRTTFWSMPMYSSRWRDAFSYGQVKTELRIGGLPVRPYLSMRLIGDLKGRVNRPYPQYLSETAVILGTGIATPVVRGLMGWAEAGLAVSYVRRLDTPQRILPDYRGGLSFSRGFGRLLGASGPGVFYENHEDAVYVSRFGRSVLFYTQNKVGYTVAPGEQFSVQIYWNANLTADSKSQYWANFVESGPGMRLRLPGMPRGMLLSVDVVRGAHTKNHGNPRRPNYFDVRAAAWYAVTR